MINHQSDYDAVVVGSGPNGLAAAIRLQQAGLSVIVLEGKETIGGGMRTAELTLPGFKHDICSAIHPMALASPYFKTLNLDTHGLEYIQPRYNLGHPFDDGSSAFLDNSIEETANSLGVDKQTYLDLFRSLVNIWPDIDQDVLAPLHFPKDPVALAKFGLKALTSASFFVGNFKTKQGRGLWAGNTAHSLQPLTNISTSAIGLVLSTVGHISGWPIPKGGSQSIADALASCFKSLGGKIETNTWIKSWISCLKPKQ